MALSISYFDTTPDGHARYLVRDVCPHPNHNQFLERLKRKAERVLSDDFVRVEPYEHHLYLVVQRGVSTRQRCTWRDLVGWIRLEWTI